MSEVKTIVCDICKRELPEYPDMRITIYKDGKNESLDVCTICEEAFKQFREHQRMTEIRNKNWKKKHGNNIGKAESEDI